ncbi:MAG TPA: HAD family phosphatase [Bacteroidia bacterium]|nr:HAD family phosphatase [Bacteroidia bacterium]
MAINNIIFDLGGVIFKIDYDLTASAFKELGLQQFDSLYSKKKQDHFFDNFEKGKLSVEDFRKEVKAYLPESVTDTQIDMAWNAMLIGIPEGRTDWLKEIGKKYRIFLLSNTNYIHINGFQPMVGPDFELLFEKVYYSCFLGMRKPDAEIFQLVIDENNLVAEETLFIDDSPQHVVGGAAVNLISRQLIDGVQVEDFVSALLKS